ncbi:MAG: phosphomannose isomerase type II C-terminal cupin domain [Patescibacteria group bacterium]|nr:phosphomannose isomerase type II C-terminal cupin domain [Patescibacteria group bacterium]
MENKVIKIYREKRPWGKFERFTQNEKSTVKIITVKAGEELSLQYHEQRNEFWRILSGRGKITIGDEIIEVKAGDEFYIPVGTKHTMTGDNQDVIFLEISLGDFDEDDIIRLKDKYER